MTKSIPKLPVAAAADAPLAPTAAESLAQANAMLAVAAEERRLLRASITDLITHLEELTAVPSRRDLFSAMREAEESMNAARLLLCPKERFVERWVNPPPTLP